MATDRRTAATVMATNSSIKLRPVSCCLSWPAPQRARTDAVCIAAARRPAIGATVTMSMDSIQPPLPKLVCLPSEVTHSIGRTTPWAYNAFSCLVEYGVVQDAALAAIARTLHGRISAFECAARSGFAVPGFRLVPLGVGLLAQVAVSAGTRALS